MPRLVASDAENVKTVSRQDASRSPQASDKAVCQLEACFLPLHPFGSQQRHRLHTHAWRPTRVCWRSCPLFLFLAFKCETHPEAEGATEQPVKKHQAAAAAAQCQAKDGGFVNAWRRRKWLQRQADKVAKSVFKVQGLLLEQHSGMQVCPGKGKLSIEDTVIGSNCTANNTHKIFF